MFGNESHLRERRAALNVVVVVGALIIAASSLGCSPEGAGKPCTFHHECADGLICDAATNTCSSCGSKASCLGVELVVHSCVAEQSPFLREPQLGFRVLVTGDELDPIEDLVSPGEGGFELPDIPLGTNRQLTIEAFKDGINNVVARGSSRPFDLSPKDPSPKLGIFLRMAQEFSPLNDVEEPTAQCHGLAEERVGHTSTLMSNGNVLIAGGHRYDEEGKAIPHASVDIYEPDTGFFYIGEPMRLARTGHTATLLDEGKVLVTGGFSYINGNLVPIRVAELYDPGTDSWTVLQMQVARAAHSAVKLDDGRVLLSGGVGAETSTEVFTPGRGAQESFALGPMIPARQNHASVALDAQRVVLIGGIDDEDTPLDTTSTLIISGDMISAAQESPSLNAPSRAPVAVTVGSGASEGILILSGNEYADWLWLEQGQVSHRSVSLPSELARRGSCAAPISGGALVAGGAELTGAGSAGGMVLHRSVDGSGLDSRATNNSMFFARSRPSCTALGSGAVLILGGETVEDGKRKAIRGAEVFQP